MKWLQVLLFNTNYSIQLICLLTVKWLQVLLFNTNYSIQLICLLTVKWLQVLLFNTNYSIQLICLLTVKWLQELLCITDYSFKHQSFVYTELNDQAVLFLTIQFIISHLFGHSLNEKDLTDP